MSHVLADGVAEILSACCLGIVECGICEWAEPAVDRKSGSVLVQGHLQPFHPGLPVEAVMVAIIQGEVDDGWIGRQFGRCLIPSTTEGRRLHQRLFAAGTSGRGRGTVLTGGAYPFQLAALD